MTMKAGTTALTTLLLAAGATTAAAEIEMEATPPANVPADTYQQTCTLPPFEWAAYGTRLTGRMYTRRAGLLGTSLYAAGYLKSTGAPDKEDFAEVADDFGVSGPYTAEDPTGEEAVSVTKDLVSYTTEHGSFAQYEVGVVKIDATTGTPQDVFVYYGAGQDETAGLAVKLTDLGPTLALSGHFVGSLSADHSDGTTTTIYNSNTNGTSDFVQHPNAIKNGFDDGFVISADADTGDAKWMVAYPKSNKDAQTVGVDLDAEGNVYGAGYSCTLGAAAGDLVNCTGFVARFAAADGSVAWARTFVDLGAAMWLKYDDEDDALYVTGTTTYFGEMGSDTMPAPQAHAHCAHDMCAVTMRLSAADGSTDWVRTAQGSPRWNFFDQTGDVELAPASDGPYVYVALDDVGEDAATSLDAGTPYAGCLADGALTPEYEIDTAKLVTAADCPAGATFVARTDAGALLAADAATGVQCGAGHDACIIKYHKYTGLPIWANDIHPVAALVPAADGKSIMATGFYWGESNTKTMGSYFDSVSVPDYNGIEGAYNAQINAETGAGEYVIHSGGVGKTRPYDAVGDADGNVYMVGYTQSAVVDWGGTLETKIIEEGVDQNDDAGTAFQMGKVSSPTKEYQFFAVKLAVSSPVALSCVESCSLIGDKIAAPEIKAGSCLIDNVCYEEDATAELFGRPCLVCDPSASQTAWSMAATVGATVCFIDNTCYDVEERYSFRESRSTTHVSRCQHCNPPGNALAWSVDTDSYGFVADVEPPNDCLNMTDDAPAAATPGLTITDDAPAASVEPPAAPVGPTVNATKVVINYQEEPPIAPTPTKKPTAMPVKDADTSSSDVTTAVETPDSDGSTDDSASITFSLNTVSGIVSALVVTILFV